MSTATCSTTSWHTPEKRCGSGRRQGQNGAVDLLHDPLDRIAEPKPWNPRARHGATDQQIALVPSTVPWHSLAGIAGQQLA